MGPWSVKIFELQKPGLGHILYQLSVMLSWEVDFASPYHFSFVQEGPISRDETPAWASSIWHKMSAQWMISRVFIFDLG
jgi:hypothetical protein